MRPLLLIALLAALAGCWNQPPSAPPEQQVVTLPSGRHVKVLGVVKMFFTADAPALMLKYQTDLSIDDRPGLAAEADEIWTTFHFDVEKAGLSTGVVSANERPQGFIVTTNRGFNTIYKRGADGKWIKQ